MLIKKTPHTKGVFLFDDGIFIDMAKSKKSIPKPTSRKTVLKRNKRNNENLELLKKLESEK